MKYRFPPGPKYFPIIGNSLAYRKDRLRFLEHCYHTYGDAVTVHFGNVPVVLFNRPATIREVLTKRLDDFVSRDVVQNVRFLMGDTIRPSNLFSSVIKACCGCMHEKAMLASDGPDHWQQRRAAHPGPSPTELHRFIEIMEASAKATVESWRGRDEVNIVDAMQELSLRIVSKALFDVDLNIPELKQAFRILLEYNVNPLKPLNKIHINVPFLPYGRYRRAWDKVERTIQSVFSNSATAGATPAIGLRTVLGLDGDSQAFPESRMHHYVFQMLGMGHATTASALSFALGLLAVNREETLRIREEIFRELGRGSVNPERLTALTRLEVAILEVLRMYPVIWTQARRATRDVELEDYFLPRGTFILMSSWLTHHDPIFFAEPDTFKPDRFNHAVRTGSRPEGYFPFGAGPHVCIGERFAMLEMKIVLATLLRHYQFCPIDPLPLRAKARTLILEPEGGLRLRLEPIVNQKKSPGGIVMQVA